MSFASSMMRKEQRRQMDRRIANATQQPRNLAGIVKEAAGLLGVKDVANNEYLCTFDCTCCNQRFVWDIRETLNACPLCGAGAKQKRGKMPVKRKTHKQQREALVKMREHQRKLRAAMEAMQQNGQTLVGQAADDERMRQQMEERDEQQAETKEQEIERTEAARAAGTLIEASCIISTGIGGGGGDCNDSDAQGGAGTPERSDTEHA